MSGKNIFRIDDASMFSSAQRTCLFNVLVTNVSFARYAELFFPIQCATALRLLSNTMNQQRRKNRNEQTKLEKWQANFFSQLMAYTIHTQLYYLFSLNIAHSDHYSWQFIYFVALNGIWSSRCCCMLKISTRRVCASSFSLFSRHMIKNIF